MKYQWTNSKVDPAYAVQVVKDFLQSEDFKTRVDEETSTHYNIYGITKTPRGKRIVILTIAQTQKGLEIDFKAGKSENIIRKTSSIFSLFGAGAIVIDAEERAEFYNRIENKLWKHLESRLSTSSSLS